MDSFFESIRKDKHFNRKSSLRGLRAKRLQKPLNVGQVITFSRTKVKLHRYTFFFFYV